MGVTAEATELLEIVTTRAADFSRKAADDLYACLLEATQDYLIDNARFNIGERIAAAERQARHDREAWGKAEARSAMLLAALKELFASYKQLADSGDAGNWRLEDQPEGKRALAAIAKAEGRS